MKCIDKIKTKLIAVLCASLVVCNLAACSNEELTMMSEYEIYNYNTDIYQLDFFASDLAVTNSDINEIDFELDENAYGAGLFDVTNGSVYYANNIFEKLFPASTTKIITAYVALKYGNLDDLITVTEEDLNISSDSSVCGLEVGDTLTLYDLLVGLLLRSGNDSAMVIARYISGDVDSFAELMTEEAAILGATNSNFINPHGLHDDEHYTTVYDLYLIFNACIEVPEFLEIIKMDSYDTIITKENGTESSVTWSTTNAYKTGEQLAPDNVTVVGGKTGYTDNAKYCLVLLTESDNEQYISIVLGAYYKSILYNEMSEMVESLPNS